MDDERLIAAVRAGDHMALKELFDRHAGWVAHRLRRGIPAHAVEDVLQETFIAVWRGAGNYRGQGDVGGWIWGIARRQAALWARRNNRPLPDLISRVETDQATMATIRADMDRAMNSLDADQRRLAMLAFVEDRSMADVARVLGIPQGTVKSRVHNLRRKLRDALGGDDS